MESSRPSNQLSNVKLQRINLKHYNGDPLAFQSFWDSFESAVHGNSAFDDVLKFNHLKSLLEGKALLAIQGLTLTKENYGNAVKLLKDRFGDPQIIIKSHMDAIIAIKPVQSSKVSALRELCDIIDVHTRNLQQFDVCFRNYGPMLLSIVTSKLPNDIKLEISRQMPPHGKWEIDTFMEAFRKEVTSRERCAFSIEDEEEGPPDPATTLLANTKDQPRKSFKGGQHNERRKGKNNITCTFCKGSHPSNRCDVVKDVPSRKAIVRQKNKCLACLKGGHEAKECWSKKRCPNCNQKHHISLCDKPNDPPAENNNNRENGAGGGGVNVNVVTTNKNILLQTAKAAAYDSHDENLTTRLSVRVLFYNCAQNTFVRSDVRDQLKLKTVRTESVSVNVFASEEGCLQQLDVVQLTLVNRKNSAKSTVDACVVPTICSKLCNQTIDAAKENYEALYGLEMADNNDVSTELDIQVLVGANYYWDFVTGKIKRCGNGLVAVHSILGWLLNGAAGIRPDTATTAMVVKTHVMSIGVDDKTTLKNELEQIWDLEQAGVDEVKPFDANAFMDEIKFDGQRYSVPLPMKKKDGMCMSKYLRPNYVQSKGRLMSLQRRLKDNPEQLKQYDDVIQNQLAEGILERCSNNVPSEGMHYLPHHGIVKNDRETTKLRVVSDASSGKPSLNDSMETGPCLMKMLLDVFLRFNIALFRFLGTFLTDRAKPPPS